MNLKEYFESTDGSGLLCTADGSGRVNAAVYARPHFLDDGGVAFIMSDRRSHGYLHENPHACYVFTETADGFDGLRLYLTAERETEDSALIDQLRRAERKATGKRYLVSFRVDEVRPLVGDVKQGGSAG